MQVETYEVERTDELNDAAGDGMAADLYEKLGLKGQERFHKSDTIEAVPYRKMTKDESLVYGILFPKIARAEDYSDGLIPLRVLELLQKAKSLNFFTRFVIWYPENADISDPILIGIVEKKRTIQYSGGSYETTDTESYILARWGECLEPFEKMKELAVKMWKENRVASLKSIIAKAKLGLEEVSAGIVKLDLSEPSAHYLVCD